MWIYHQRLGNELVLFLIHITRTYTHFQQLPLLWLVLPHFSKIYIPHQPKTPAGLTGLSNNHIITLSISAKAGQEDLSFKLGNMV